MKKLNNKGFAVSTVLYGITMLVFLAIVSIMAIMATNRISTRSFINKLKEELLNIPRPQDRITANGTFVSSGGGSSGDDPETDNAGIKFFTGNVDTLTGNVDTLNNVIFANKCWRVVRTTNNRGLKLVYNGEVIGNNSCNERGEDAFIGTSEFNKVPTTRYSDKSTYCSLADVGYMYGTRYYNYSVWVGNSTMSPTYTYGKDVTYKSPSYSLSSTQLIQGYQPLLYGSPSIDYRLYRYTRFNNSSLTNTVYYVYGITTSAGSLDTMVLTGGVNYSQAKINMFTNNNNSTIKEMLETWYKDNLIEYADKLMDDIWCNDRTMFDSSSTSGKVNYFGAVERVGKETPSLECEPNDSFTVDPANGNGKLTYPIGLLTADEVYSVLKEEGENSYLVGTPGAWWTMSPAILGSALETYGGVSVVAIDSNGKFITDTVSSRVNQKLGVRPAIVINGDSVYVVSGNGRWTSPYILE